MSDIKVALVSPDEPFAEFFCPRCGFNLAARLDRELKAEDEFPIAVGPFSCQCGHRIRLSILGWELNPTCERPARLSGLQQAIPYLERALSEG